MKKKAPPRPICLSVVENNPITPHMRRIVLTGSALATYPAISTSAYIKLLFDLDGNPLDTPPSSKEAVQMRTYTIRALERQNKRLSIDMALHGEGSQEGPASHWAKHAQPGSSILVGGPGNGKPLAKHYDWVLFAGDMTSLPAIASHLEALPSNVHGYAVIQITSEEDKQLLKTPDNVQVKWVIGHGSQLVENVAQLPWLTGIPAIWAACEFSSMRGLRTLFRDQRQVPHSQLYISSYWREGRSEDQHKVDKRKDAEAFATAK
ncbi:siderophore-interacting protein [Alteromonas sp. C1M14]|uniref:siderophore-interacting protein n=1 Tax=Alteromonas sp. C1M14 TaxID=2841567 RepID=UPI001C08DD49|nr:siderophore-interacting protein [Alteromonas sp. C1M14]MBU2978120.1 siderophore-interacting protein [Alteromonas sp. C1M14]